MSTSKTELQELLHHEEFALSNSYDPQWVLDNQMGPNALWLTEWLCRDMDLRPGTRVLDMGCGRGLSSVLLAKEFGVQVWAADLWIKPTDNWERIREAGVQDRVFPIHAEAHALPFAEGFFDAIVCVDAYQYFGTDDLYLRHFAKLVKPGGQIGIATVGLTQDFLGGVPEHLMRPRQDGSVFWGQDCWCFHTADWWRHLWQRTGLVDVKVAETMADGWQIWLRWAEAVDVAMGNSIRTDAETLLADAGRYIGLVRMIARRREPEA